MGKNNIPLMLPHLPKILVENNHDGWSSYKRSLKPPSLLFTIALLWSRDPDIMWGFVYVLYLLTIAKHQGITCNNILIPDFLHVGLLQKRLRVMVYDAVWVFKLERLFSSLSYHLHYIDFWGSPVSFYDITPSFISNRCFRGGSVVVAASHVLVAAAFW